MLDKLLIELQSNGFIFEESLVFKNIQDEFWQSTLIQGDIVYSSGLANDRLNARKIATSEYLERVYYRNLATSSNESTKREWGLDIIPTACGFAAGFNRSKTVYRSLTESIERWVMSKWIDEKYFIEAISPNSLSNLDPLSKSLASYFDSVLFFKKDVVINFNNNHFIIPVGQTMGLKGNGIYPGSSAQNTGGSLWQHALIESFRHYLLVQNNKPIDKFPDNKIRFFSKNASLALEQISQAYKIDWPLPEVVIHKSVTINDDYFIARTILGGWQSWDQGPIERFLY